jgi:hypothetical protein
MSNNLFLLGRHNAILYANPGQIISGYTVEFFSRLQNENVISPTAKSMSSRIKKEYGINVPFKRLIPIVRMNIYYGNFYFDSGMILYQYVNSILPPPRKLYRSMSLP